MKLSPLQIIGIIVTIVFTIAFIALVVKSGLNTKRFLREFDERQAAMKKDHEEIMAQLPSMTDEEKIAKIHELMNRRYKEGEKV
jgi:uncharacterized membrane protein (DUF106 family)